MYSLKSKNQSDLQKWMRIYCLVNASVEIIAFVLARFGVNNIPLFYILILTEISVIIQFFYVATNFVFKIKKLHLFIFVYSILLALIFQLDSFKNFSTYVAIFEGFIVFIFCLFYLANEIKNPSVSNIVKAPVFWFVSAFLIYYGCSWLILLGTQLFAIEQELFIYIWDGQNILNILKNVLITIGLLCLR